MLVSTLFVSFLSSSSAFAAPTAKTEEASNVQRRDPWWVSRPFSWGNSGIGSAITGAVVGSTIGGAWQGVKNAFGSNSNSDEERQSSDELQPDGSNIVVIPYPYPANQPSGYAPSYPQNQNGPQWQNTPSYPQNQGYPRNQNGPQWQNVPSYSQNQNVPQGHDGPQWQQTQPVPQARPNQQDSQSPSAGLAVTLSSPVVCRKYPDTIISGPLDTYPGGSRIFAKCWTTASMSGALGKIENSPIWVKTDRGCYVSEAEIEGSVDFQSKLSYCVAPAHWAATVQTQYAEKVDCYQCPTLKCPNFSIGRSKTVDVQCLVDGEDARGNSTWVKPVDYSCYLPAEIFIKEGWLGTPSGKC